MELLRRLLAVERRLERLMTIESGSATGTFTPAVAGSGTAGTFTYTTSLTTAQYTRVGDRVFINGRIVVTATAVAPTGNISITGLPIVSGASDSNILGLLNIVWTGVNLQAGYTEVEGVVTAASSAILLHEMGDNVAVAVLQGGELAGAFQLYFAGHYKV